ncbi:MAG: hypothetical protein NC548_58610, partial [Lachnospiraceae bacterium]|nr:hypothetical protein [Lachnospiraceae bacterium]
FTIGINSPVIILQDANIQNYTSYSCAETVCAVLLDIAGSFIQRGVATHFADWVYVACISSWRKAEGYKSG